MASPDQGVFASFYCAIFGGLVWVGAISDTSFSYPYANSDFSQYNYFTGHIRSAYSWFGFITFLGLGCDYGLMDGCARVHATSLAWEHNSGATQA